MKDAGLGLCLEEVKKRAYKHTTIEYRKDAKLTDQASTMKEVI